VASKKRNTKKKPTLYNKILKEFTKVNDKLPEDRKLSVRERRKLIKEKILPIYKGQSPNRVGIRAINANIVALVDTIPPRQDCDINLIPPSFYFDIAWFDLDSFITNVLPKCVYIRVDAGDFGITQIFNTRDYSYGKNGIKEIVENIREYVDNKSGVDLSFNGYKKLKANKANDGTPENYYLDIIISVNGEPIRDVEPVIYEVKTQKRARANKVKQIILERLKDLAAKKRSKKRIRKKANAAIKSIKALTKRLDFVNKTFTSLDKAFEKGLITKAQFAQLTQKLFNEAAKMKEGGEI
jgi:hypothetical protein